MGDRAFGDGIAYLHARIEAGKRVLKNSLHAGRDLGAVLHHWRAVDGHRPGGRRQNARNHAPKCRLAATRLADQPQGFSLVDRQGNIRYRADRAGLNLGTQLGGYLFACAQIGTEQAADIVDGQERAHAGTSVSCPTG